MFLLNNFSVQGNCYFSLSVFLGGRKIERHVKHWETVGSQTSKDFSEAKSDCQSSRGQFSASATQCADVLTGLLLRTSVSQMHTDTTLHTPHFIVHNLAH